jgi:hypothetical protein
MAGHDYFFLSIQFAGANNNMILAKPIFYVIGGAFDWKTGNLPFTIRSLVAAGE